MKIDDLYAAIVLALFYATVLIAVDGWVFQ